jgi:hypothetical protein
MGCADRLDQATMTKAEARELAARALCRHGGKPEELWVNYLPAADAVLEAIGWREPQTIPVYRMREVPEKG